MLETPRNPNYSIDRIFVREMYLSPLELGQETPKAFKQSLSVYQQVLAESGVVMITTRVEISSEDLSTTYGVVSVLSAFRLKDIDMLLNEDNQPNYEVAHELNNHAISTTRGVMFGLLRGTYLNDAILPLLDSRDLYKSIEEVEVNPQEEE